MRRSALVVAIAAATGVTLGSGTVAAVTTAAAHHKVVAPAADGKIYACYTKAGHVRLISKSSHCAHAEKRVSWVHEASRPTKPVFPGRAGAPPYGPDFKGYDAAGFANLSFMRDGAGRVFLDGLACITPETGPQDCGTGVMISGSKLVFRLPSGFRPPSRQVFQVMSYNQFDGESGKYYQSRVDVLPDGEVMLIAQPSAGYQSVTFEGISFRATH
jgi:hypothetical protein